MSTSVAATPVSPSMVLAIVDEARAMKYPPGVVGLRGVPDRAALADLEHDGHLVRVRPAESALAVREALAEHRSGDWMVVVTDREDDDLGAGVLAHFIWQRLRSPDPWEAVRHRFSATGIDPGLTAARHSRDLAAALLAASPSNGWPAAPAGVLTRAHALTSVAKARLGLSADAADTLGVLQWTMRPASVTAVAELRADVGDRLADETLEWIAERAGPASAPVRALLRRGEMADILPVGVVVHLLTSEHSLTTAERHLAELALVRLEPSWGSPAPPLPSLRALGNASAALLADLVHDLRETGGVERVLHRADAILGQVQAEQLSVHSDLLPRGFRSRLTTLSEKLGQSVGTERRSSSEDVERAWADVCAHRLGSVQGPLLTPFHAAVRLSRWLESAPSCDGADLAALVRRHMEQSSWADAAINDAYVGVDDPDLAPALAAVIDVAQERRSLEERTFAAALAHSTGDSAASGEGVDGLPAEGGTVWYLERLLPGRVIPMAKRAPVLLLVMDGMSVAAANEILDDATNRLGWLEAALPEAGGRHRSAGLSVLPSLTGVSRASLLCGRLEQGQQTVELAGYHELTVKAGKITAVLFHKKGVETTARGWSVSDDVGAALDDAKTQLVTVVLNTIDDALDRSDPVGTTWTADAVKHLEPLLARARAAGRTVVMTADHGHVVERRHGTQRAYPDLTSGRSRAATGTVQDGEIEVTGARVLTPDHRAVLAVDEGLRYGPLKAGYHGGASGAEVVVPVAVLVPGEDSNPLGLTLLPPQMPIWWLTQDVAPAGPARATQPTVIRPAERTSRRAEDRGPTLFDDVTEPSARSARSTLGRSVVTSEVYRAQRTVAGRLIVTDEQIDSLIEALAGAPAARVPMTLAATALSVNEIRLRGALAQVQQLLNVEGYAVIGTDPDTSTVILDERLLREQFGVR